MLCIGDTRVTEAALHDSAAHCGFVVAAVEMDDSDAIFCTDVDFCRTQALDYSRWNWAGNVSGGIGSTVLGDHMQPGRNRHFAVDAQECQRAFALSQRERWDSPLKLGS